MILFAIRRQYFANLFSHAFVGAALLGALCFWIRSLSGVTYDARFFQVPGAAAGAAWLALLMLPALADAIPANGTTLLDAILKGVFTAGVREAAGSLPLAVTDLTGAALAATADKGSLIDDPLYTRDMSLKETWNRDESESSTGERSGEESSSTDASEDVTTNGTSKSAASDASESKSHEDANQSTSSSDRNVFQDTPMNGLDTGAIQAMDYATNVTFDEGSTSSESERDTTGSTTNSRTETGETSETRDTSAHSATDGTSHESMTDARTGRFDGSREHRETGYDRPQSELLLTYRKTLVNVDLMIVDSCASLFMGLW